jgi:two-component system, sensor histidine kinase YesM
MVKGAKKVRNFEDSIRYMFLRYSLMSIVIALVLFSIFVVVMLKINIIINTTQANKIINENISKLYENYYNEINNVSSSSNLVKYIKTKEDGNLIFDEFYKFNKDQDVKGVFEVVDTSGNFIISTAYSDSNFDADGYIRRNIIPKLKEKPDETYVEENFIKYQNDSTAITFAKAVKDNNEIIGYALLMVFKSPLEEMLFVKNNELAVFTDKRNRVIVTTNNSVKGLVNKFNPQVAKGNKIENVDALESGSYYMKKTTLPKSNFNIYTLNSLEIKNTLFIVYGAFLMIVGFLFWFLLNHLANRMSKENTKSIDKLICAVNKLKTGDTSHYVNIKTGDEFEVLGDEYNSMLDTLNSLMIKNKELSKLKYQSEMKLLQSQFNPHFIFNILETLRYSIYIAPKDTEKIIIKLASLLRYSINYEADRVTLDKDICYIEDFLELNKFRFKDMLNYNFFITDKAKEALVPKLLIQTLVENSIKYGYITKDSLKIDIICENKEDKLIIEVKDNGSGINEETLKEVQEIISKVENNSNHIGLHNLYRRLELFYGENKSFQISSTLGVGTSIKIELPYEL